MTSLSTHSRPTSRRPAADRDRAERIERLRDAAYRIRLNALLEGRCRARATSGRRSASPTCSPWPTPTSCATGPTTRTGTGRDRFLLSIGHYAIALYAALAEAGIIPVEELETYGSDDSRLPMSGMASYTPGMEISGGSLGHGLAVATGMALGLRHQGNPARVYNLLSDGELDEGSTWEAALQIAHHGLDNVTAIVDVNALQADGPTDGRPAHRAGPGQVAGVRLARPARRRQRHRGARRRVRRAPRPQGSPGVLICDTRIGRGVPLLETREKAHFMRVAEHEWQIARDQLAEGTADDH